MPQVNPKILVWARETAHLSLEEAVKKLDIREARGRSAVERLADLEVGETEPTRPMLVKMAKQYRRPLLTFYMSSPPKKGNRGEDFRTLPQDYSVADDALLDVLVRDVVARQSMVRAVLEDEDEAAPLEFIGSAKVYDGVEAVLTSIRETLQVDLAKFYRESTPTRAFGLLRDLAEEAGVFVLLIGNLGSYHTAIELEIFRGFSLADQVAPFVIINDQDSRSAWSFTLLHELTHLWLGQTGVSGENADRSIERFCNDVAGEFLLPDEEIELLNVGKRTPFDTAQARISEFAMNRNLSSSMVAYKLFRRDTIEIETWRRLIAVFRDRWRRGRAVQRERARERDGGPTYYTMRRHRVGKALVQFVSRMLDGGALTTTKAGKVLGVRAKNVGPLIERTRSA
ncbi:MAG: ImmA/IrrE family metallo-endopeptidase [Anaerolineales bacterium]